MEDDHKIQKKGFRGLFLPKNDLKTWSAVIVPKKQAEFGGLETKWRHEV